MLEIIQSLWCSNSIIAGKTGAIIVRPRSIWGELQESDWKREKEKRRKDERDREREGERVRSKMSEGERTFIIEHFQLEKVSSCRRAPKSIFANFASDAFSLLNHKVGKTCEQVE